MITYAERSCFDAQHLRLLSRVQARVARVSNTWGNELRCHELARAIQLTESDHLLSIVDGHCGPIEHSWLCCTHGVILDPYVPGRLPAVQMIDALVGTAYRPGDQRTDIRHEYVERLVLEMLEDDGNATEAPARPARRSARG